MPVYRPTARVRFDLRLDEGANDGELKKALERGSAPNSAFGSSALASAAAQQAALALLDKNRAALIANRANMAPEAYMAALGQMNAQRRDLRQALGIVNGTVEDALHVVFSVIPREVSYERKNLSDAATWEVTFDFRHCPIDPRSIRSCGVSILVGSVTQEDWEAGLLDGALDQYGIPVSIVGGDAFDQVGGNVRMIGFTDEWKIELGEDGEEVTISGRDMVGLLMDTKMPESAGIDLTAPILDGVRELLGKFPSLSGIEVFYSNPITQPTEADFTKLRVEELFSKGPTPSDNMQLAQPASGKKARKKRQPRDKETNVWDHLVETLAKLALIPVMRGTFIWICQSRSVLALADDKRKMVWGRNLSSLEFSRKTGAYVTPTIEMRCWDQTRGRMLWARHPVLDNEPSHGILGRPGSPQPVTSRPARTLPDGTTEETISVQYTANVTDPKVLRDIAQENYERAARQEIEATFETKDMESFENQSDAELDLLDLFPGEPVVITSAEPGSEGAEMPHASSFLELTTMTVDQRAGYFKSIGFAPDAAQALAQAQEQGELQNTFRCNAMKVSWSSDDGVQVTGELINYIVVRPGNENETDAAQGIGPNASTLNKLQQATNTVQSTAQRSGQ